MMDLYFLSIDLEIVWKISRGRRIANYFDETNWRNFILRVDYNI